MRFLIIGLLIYIYKKRKILIHSLTNSNTLYLEYELPFIKNVNNNSVKGYDVRYINNTNETKQIENEINKYKLMKMFEKKKLLDILENEKIAIPLKINLLQNNSIYGFNILAGLKKEDFDFF